MFGRKKKEEIPVPPEPVKTKTLQADISKKEQIDVSEWLAQEFKPYIIFNEEDIQKSNPEVISCNILYGIWAELRLIREKQ